MNTLRICKWIFLGMSFFVATSCQKISAKKGDSQDEPRRTEDEQESNGTEIRFRSLPEVNYILQSRLFKDDSFDILNLLINVPFDSLTGAFGNSIHDEVGSLLGMYQGLGLRVADESMKASSVFALLWGLTYQNFAENISQLCTNEPSTLKFQPQAEEILRKTCLEVGASRNELYSLWMLFLGQDGTSQEFERWYLDEKQTIETLTSKERLTYIVKSLLFSAEFMIGR